MAIPRLDPRDEELKQIIQRIAVICLSEEFAALRRELEGLYFKSEIEDAMLVAFQDALYSMLAQEEEVNNLKSRAF